ncbi:MAG: GWxTD domain-containing protein [bacterium]
MHAVRVWACEFVAIAIVAGAVCAAGTASSAAADDDKSLDNPERAFRAILSEEEMREYTALSEMRRDGWQQRFWKLNDPDPTTARNERLEEHERRIAKARELFAGGGPLKWDDRCEALVRYGEPLVRVEDGGEVHSRVGLDPPRERWLYQQVFLYMEDRNLDGRFEFGISSQASNIAMIDHFGEEESFIRDQPNEVENPILDFEGRPEVEEHFPDFSPQKLIKMLDKGREAWVKEPRAYATDRTGREIPFYFDVSTFRAADSASGSAEIVVNFLIPYEPLARDERGVWVERRTVVFDEQQNTVGNAIEAIEQGPPEGEASTEWIVNSATLAVAPGKYQIANRVVDLVSPGREMGLSRTETDVPNYGSGEFAMSDVLFGSAIEAVADGSARGAGVVRRGLRIVPMPVRRFDRQIAPHIYFEVYNLTPNEAGRYKYQVDYTLTKREPRGFFAAVRGVFRGTLSSGVAVTFDREVSAPESENWIEIDTRELPPDTYFIESRVRDMVSGREASRRESFVIVGAAR